MSSRFIHVVAYDRISFFLKLNNISLHEYTTFSLPIYQWTFRLLPSLGYWNNVAMNMGVQISLQDPLSILLVIYPKVGLLDCLVVLFLMF